MIKDFSEFKRKCGPAGAPWVCVFGTSDAGDTPSVAAARRLGAALARAGCVVVTGGYGAAMEAANRGAHEAGGLSVGVTCRMFTRDPNPFLDEIVPTNDLIERMTTLIGLGDAYVAGKGGTGTLAEIALTWEFVNKRLISPRPLVLCGGFWDALPALMKDAGAHPGVSLGRAGDSILTAADENETVQLIRDFYIRLGRNTEGGTEQ